MIQLLWLIPVLPLAGAVVNGLFGRRLPHAAVSAIACLLPAGSFALSLAAFFQVKGGEVLRQTVFQWIAAGDATLPFGLQVDALTAVMILVVTGVGSLIHVYSIGYMHGDKGYARYFAYLNLFLFAMLVLVMADNLAVMFVGWEGVGLCSYLLIGFWYDDPHKADAGKKAFIVNRIGDLGFLLGMFLLFAYMGSLDFQTLASRALPTETISLSILGKWTVPELAGLLLFVGACGKSAQIPLYVWLPDAMAGPTPVSALIHAATMVTAGVYMMGRMHFLYAHIPAVNEIIVFIGAATALFAAVIAVAQFDIKKILAYSTISQLGFMFAGMAAAQYWTGVFHLVTHAFFKALLFLGAGAVIHKLGGEQDIRKMGGLAQKNRLLFMVFGAAWLAIAGVPALSGFFSKDAILVAVYAHPLLKVSFGFFFGYAFLVATACLTAFYMTRLVMLVFFGKAREDHGHGHPPGATMMVPLMMLAVLSIFGGYLPVEQFLTGRAPHPPDEAHHFNVVVSIGASLLGIGAGIAMFGIRRVKYERMLEGSIVERKFLVDELYDYAVVMPVRMGATILWFVFDRILIDTILVHGVGWVVVGAGRAARKLHAGALSGATAGIVVGAVAALGYLAYRLLGHG